MKKSITINVDVDAYEEFKKMVGNGNLSNNINEYIKEFVNNNDGIESEYDLNILRMEAEQLRSIITKKKAEMQHKISIINNIEETAKQKEIEQLRKEQEKKLQQKSCLGGCGLVDNGTEKFHQFKTGVVCHNCFMTGNNSERWK